MNTILVDVGSFGYKSLIYIFRRCETVHSPNPGSSGNETLGLI